MRRRGEVGKAAQKYKAEKNTGEVLSGELKKIQDKYKTSETSTNVMIESADDAFNEYKKVYEDSAKVVYPKVKLIGSRILLTTALYSIDDAGVFLVKQGFNLNAFKELAQQVDHRQTVAAVGPLCNQVKKGDKVVFSPQAFTRIKNPNSVKAEEVSDLGKHLKIIDDRSYLMLDERDIDYIIDK